MPKIKLVSLVTSLLLSVSMQAQVINSDSQQNATRGETQSETLINGNQATTYPIDSCIYFMEPYNFLVRGDAFAAPGGGQQAKILFRSTNNPAQLVRGQGRLIINPEDFPGGDSWLRDSLFIKAVMTPPEFPDNGSNWPGGQPPFPLLLNGFVQEGNGEPLDPWRPVTIRVIRVLSEDLTE